jgi:primosomal protein N' (replication factor Y)
MKPVAPVKKSTPDRLDLPDNLRPSFENIPINLVTAVPSIETYENIKKGKYTISRLEHRYQNASLPNYEIINLNETKLEKQSWLSKKIIDKVNSHLDKNDQVLFFLNRRGFSPHVLCNKCFNSYSCPNCSVNLVYHKNKNNLLCHYCGFKTLLKRDCIKDGNCDFIFSGPGVERISEEVKKNFPSKKIEIFSSDTMNKKNSVDKLEKIINNEVQILVGTQLISKGFHFPSLNCSVVVDIDLSSQGHDLRGAEKNLQLYHQLSGRAGRAGKPAMVYFQTYNTNAKMISDLTNSNPDIFLNKELEIRRQNNLPPFQRFISLILTGDNENKLEKEAFNLKSFIENKIEGRVLGPVSAPIFRLKKKYRIRLLIRGPKSLKLQNSLATLIPNYKFPLGIKLSVDVDPINFN